MSGAATFNLLTRLLNYVFAIPFLILGIIGAVLTVIVFTRKRAFRQNTTINYLLAGAIVTGIHLPAIYIQMILVYGFNISLMNTNVAACHEHTYLRYVTTVAAISFPCWASFDQYAITSRQVAFRNRWSSPRIARIIIVCNMIFWILIYIPVLFFTGIRYGVCVFIPSPYTTFNTYVFTPLVYCICPIAVVTYCTRGTIQNLRSNIILNTHDRLSKQVRAMLVPQLIILSISGIPFGFQGVYLDITSYIEKDTFRIAIENFAGQVILIFYHFNYVFTFYIYLIMSSEVRKVLQRDVFGFMRKTRVSPFNVKIDNSISLRPLNNINS